MKKILFLIVLALGVASCSQDESIEQATITTRAGIAAAFTNIERYSDNASEQISGDITCSAPCEVSFKIAYRSYTTNEMVCTVDAGDKHYVLNYSDISDFKANLPEGTSKVILKISRKDLYPSQAYARMIITDVKGGNILGPDNAYGDLVVNMDK